MFPVRWWVAEKHNVNAAAGKRRRPARRRQRYRPVVEILERRLAPAVTLSISNPVPFPKPDSGQLTGLFVVTRSGDAAPGVVVDYATQDGTGPNGAHAGTDYVATRGTLEFAPYQVTASIGVPILGNTVFQADKTFTVSLSDPVPTAGFGVAQFFVTGSQPVFAAVGDFNGDGKPDLAIANYHDNTVSVLLNTTPAGATNPSFATRQTFATANTPFALAVGDFNGDGKPDLAVASSSGVQVLVNTTPVQATTASFAFPQTVDTNGGAIAVGDFNGDGKPDLAIGGVTLVSMLLNTTPAGASAPSFAPPQSFPTGGYISTSLVVGDFNGDGKPDLAVADNVPFPPNFGTLTVLLNTTPAGATVASFAPRQTYPLPRYGHALALGDFNGDGKPDLAVTDTRYGGVSVLFNMTPAGATTASFVGAGGVASDVGTGPVVVADFSGDGKPDLLLSTGRALELVLNRTPAGATAVNFAPQQTLGALPGRLAVGDFNGDGKPDLVVANGQSNTVSVLLNQTAPITLAPSFAPQQTFATGSGPDWVAVADFNGDGKPDLAITSQWSDTVSVLLNTTPAGASLPTFAPGQTFATGKNPVSVALGDFNGDGKPDLVVANAISNTVSVLLNTTPAGATIPTFAAQQTFATGRQPNAVAVGDFNGDGKPDLAVANYRSGSVSVLLNTTPTGATSPSFASQQTFAAGLLAYAVTVGDLNGDGKPDLIVANDYGNFRNGSVSVLLNTTLAGATIPSFTPQQTFTTGSRPFLVAVGDFNGDGRPDLAVANFTSNTVSVLLNTTPVGATSPSFALQQTFLTGTPSSVAVGDFNGDGEPDLATTNWGSGTVTVLADTTVAGATTPSFAPAQVFTAGTDPSSVAVGDFNGDGKLDLASTNFSAGTVSVLTNSLPIAFAQSLATGTISSALEAPMMIAIVPGTAPQFAAVNAAFAVPLAVDVRNAAGHLVQGVSVTFTAPANGPSGLFGNNASVTVVTNASGRATAPAFTANTIAGSYMVMAQAAGGSDPTTGFNLTNLPAAAASLTLTDLPATLTAGTPTNLTVTARDPFNNIATGYTGRVHFLSSDRNAILPDDYSFTATDHGVHTFTGVTLQTAGIHFVTAYDTVDPRIDGISSGVRVVPAAPDHLAVTTSAADPEVAGTPFDVSVTVQDAYGNTVTSYTSTVTFSSADPYGASLPPDYTFRPADQGRVIFPGGATLYTAGTWDVTATDTSSGITGTAFVNVASAPAVAFQVLAPESATSGTPFDVTVVAADPYGNTDTHYQGTVTFATSDIDPGIVLPSDYTFQPTDQGTATFPGGVTLVTPGDQTLTVTDAGSGITGSTIVTVSGPGPTGVTQRRKVLGAYWREIGTGDAVRVEALDGLVDALRRRRPHGLTGDELPWEAPG